jgi:hypothetical protein
MRLNILQVAIGNILALTITIQLAARAGAKKLFLSIMIRITTTKKLLKWLRADKRKLTETARICE